MTTQTLSANAAGGSLLGSAWLGQASPGAIGWAERGLVPDWMIRLGIRRLLRERLATENAGGLDALSQRHEQRFAEYTTGPLAICTDDANRQHYEVPADFFEIVLGPHRKYSSAWFADGQDDLGEAESAMLAMTCERAELADGQHILELGCGWGSLTLFMAERYPNARIVAVSNSHRQRTAILARAAAAGLNNIDIITADLRSFESDRRFDRIVSVECFEHMRNHRELFHRIRKWLHPDGRCFVHVFTHRSACYPFEDGGNTDWMARHFFAGGMMLSDEWFLRLQDDLVVDGHWRVSGHHYAHTARHWLQRLDRRRQAVEQAFLQDGLDARAARLQCNRWRIFFIACEELWGFRGGAEWHVSHYRFRARA